MPLPEFVKANQRIKRRPVNPADKSTIVSIYPRPIDEVKHTIFPGRFIIPAAKKDDFELLVIGSSSYFKEIDPDQPMLEVVQFSSDVAKAVIDDYCQAKLAVKRSEMSPGLFWIHGGYNKTTILKYQSEPAEGEMIGKSFKDLLAEAQKKQRSWFIELVKLGDINFSTSNGHPMSVSDEMRMACKELGFDRPWMGLVKDITKEPCRACGWLIDPAYPVCPNCKNVINHDRAKELNLKFAV